MPIDIRRSPPGFRQWSELLGLLHAAFAFQTGRIDPPSSLHEMDAGAIAQKASDEHLFLAFDGGELVGCAFAKAQAGSLYVGKFAVQPDRQGQGIGRLLMQSIESFARESGHGALELNTRIELTENHATFRALGFVKKSENSHAGYSRATSITMRKALDEGKPRS